MNIIGGAPRPITGARRADPKADPVAAPEPEKKEQTPYATADASSAPSMPSQIAVKPGNVDIAAELRMLQAATTTLQVSQVVMKLQQKLMSANTAASFDDTGKTAVASKRIQKAINTAQKKFRNISKEDLMQARQQTARQREEAQKLREELSETRRKNRRQENKEIRKIEHGEEERNPFETATLPGAGGATTSDVFAPSAPVPEMAAEAVTAAVDAASAVAAPPVSLDVVV